MVTLAYNPIDEINPDIIISDINTYNPDKIIIFNELEWELKQLNVQLIDFIKAKNIDLKIIFGSYDDEYYDNWCSSIGLDKSNCIFWSTYWINWTEMCLRSNFDYQNYKLDTNFKYPFICLNNKNHIHREALIDHIAKYDLLDRGIVTWHKFNNQINGYKFKYYDNSIRTIDDDFTTKLDSFLLPHQHFESFFHLVGEANINVHFISEKTILPILLKKPFACISKKGYNKRLTDLGFVLYDELIDYSYDDYDDVVDRADILCKSIANMSNNYTELYEMLRPKIEHNYNRCLEIIHDKFYVPQIIFDRVQTVDKNEKMFTDHRYENIVRMCK